MAKFELIGFLAKDPEIKYFESGKVKTACSIPERKGRDKPTVWRNLEAWGSVAEALSQFKKSDRLKLTGFTKEDSYTKDGVEIIKDIWVVETIGKIDKKESNNESNSEIWDEEIPF